LPINYIYNHASLKAKTKPDYLLMIAFSGTRPKSKSLICYDCNLHGKTNQKLWNPFKKSGYTISRAKKNEAVQLPHL
jgi:predicted transcriptional regulator